MKKIAYILLVALLLLTSCKRYLDIKPYGQTIPKTADEFSSLLNSTLDKIDYGEGNIVGDITSVAYLECYADNLERKSDELSGGGFHSDCGQCALVGQTDELQMDLRMYP